LRKGSYRFYFYAGDRDEPIHVHVEREDRVAKVWLNPVRLQSSGGFSRPEIRQILSLVSEHKKFLQRSGMRTSTIELEVPAAATVRVTEDTLSVDLSDGRTISVPLAWYPRLARGTVKERNNWRLIGPGYGIHWEDLDEDISVENLLLGQASGESQSSFERWLSSRRTRRPAPSGGRGKSRR
jgi:hypothetical protein